MGKSQANLFSLASTSVTTEVVPTSNMFGSSVRPLRVLISSDDYHKRVASSGAAEVITRTLGNVLVGAYVATNNPESIRDTEKVLARGVKQIADEKYEICKKHHDANLLRAPEDQRELTGAFTSAPRKFKGKALIQ